VTNRGRKPTPPHLHLVQGTRNTTRHGTEDELRTKIEQGLNTFGTPVKPEIFTQKKYDIASQTWDRYIAPAWWLDASREMLAIGYCMLFQEMIKRGASFPSAKHGQLRSYAAELGLTDERKRPADASKKPKNNLLD
jgi:hypothetical protein